MAVFLRFLMLLLFLATSLRCSGQDSTIAPDVVCGHKFGLAMTCDVFTPTENTNGAAVLFMVSSGWYSNGSPPEQKQHMFRPLTDFSDRVNTVVADVASTDSRLLAQDTPNRLPASQQFPALAIAMKTAEVDSPLVHVTPDDAPTMLIAGAHYCACRGTLLLAGSKDELVPVEHRRNIEAAFEQVNVTRELIKFENAGPGIGGDDAEEATAAVVDWFVTHLAEKKP